MSRTTLKIYGGDILVTVLVFAAIAITVTVGLVNWGATLLKEIRSVQAKEQSFQIAEAGIDYYRWHLAQYPTDYQDGSGQPGPYNHSFYDKDGNLIGGYSLAITAPPLGSTKVTIASTGTTTGSTPATSTIQAALAEPSLAQYAVIANDYMRFGSGTTIYGPVSSNNGIHFDGVAHNVVSSALATATDPDSGSCTSKSYGVHTCIVTADPVPPAQVSSYPSTHTSDVFLAGRQIVSAFPFSSLTVNLNGLLNIATNNGQNLCSAVGPNCWLPSGASGYYMHINTNNTYSMYRVTGLLAAPNNCNTDGAPQWGTWSYTTTSLIGTYSVPANGVIFVEDNLWVDGTNIGQSVSTRVTIAAAANLSNMSSTTGSNITINNNLTYAAYDGSDVIGLIAQANLNVGLVSSDALQIDAALVAESGRVGRYYYNPSYTSTYHNNTHSYTWSGCGAGGQSNGTGGIDYSERTSLTLNGMIATDFRYGFAYVGSNPNCSDVSNGYCTRNLNYDGNLLYSPPPNFPLASTQYQLASWRQLQ